VLRRQSSLPKKEAEEVRVMSILVDKNTKVVVQGITGKEGSFHATQCKAYGTQVVAGVTPGKAGQNVEGIPVFNTVEEAVKETGANCSLIFVPAPFAADAIVEALDSGIELVVCITEGIPVKDMMMVKDYMKKNYPDAKLIGPNCPGLITPGEAKVGIMPGHIFKRGSVGIGIGGDPVHGLSHRDVIALFNEDPETEAILMIGEIGGTAEEEAAEFIEAHVEKPVFAYIAGITAPPGKRMGHAGAIIMGGKGTAQAKMEALEKAGAYVIDNPAKIGETVAKILGILEVAEEEKTCDTD